MLLFKKKIQKSILKLLYENSPFSYRIIGETTKCWKSFEEIWNKNKYVNWKLLIFWCVCCGVMDPGASNVHPILEEKMENVPPPPRDHWTSSPCAVGGIHQVRLVYISKSTRCSSATNVTNSRVGCFNRREDKKSWIFYLKFRFLKLPKDFFYLISVRLFSNF